MANTATFIKQRNGNSHSTGKVYQLDPPMPVHNWDAEDHNWEDACTGDGVCHRTEFVWVSAAVVTYSGPETYIFRSDADGKVLDWGELPGSFKGALDHEQALRNAGYEVA